MIIRMMNSSLDRPLEEAEPSSANRSRHFAYSERKQHFLTGATGLVGSYILRQLLLDNEPVAVLVRQSRRQSPQDRINTMIAHWEQRYQRSLPRPFIMVGDLSDPEWGHRNHEWFSSHCKAILHCAASLQFRGAPGYEPWVSNLEGTRNILQICQRTGIRHLHYVSTAYVAGVQTRFREDQLDDGQTLRNDYEQSKMLAEKMVRGVDFLDSLTVYRPAIVVGDSQTGETTTYHGFYAILKLAHTLAAKMPRGTHCARSLLQALGLTGSEHKNFVPVDWVSRVMYHIYRHPELHGQTYHLTSPRPTPTLDFADVIQNAVETYSTFAPPSQGFTEDWFHTTYADQLDIYRAYIQEDPFFDSTNTQRAAPHLPCPEINSEMLSFLASCAILSDFGKKKTVVKSPRSKSKTLS